MSEFVEYLAEVFEPFGQIHARKMFGGYGIYYEGIMFGLVADHSLYLKADASTAAYFEEQGLEQFIYNRGEKSVKMSFYLAPEEIFENPEDAVLWAKRAYEVAVRTKSSAKPKSTSRNKNVFP